MAAAGAPDNFENLAQTVRSAGVDAGAVGPQRLAGVDMAAVSNYSLAVSGRDGSAGGLKTQTSRLMSASTSTSPRMTAPVGFSENTAAQLATPSASTAVTSEVNSSVGPPVPEAQNNALMIAGLVALAFMAARRGRG